VTTKKRLARERRGQQKLRGTLLLVLDIGNTNIVVGVYRRQKLISHWRLSSNRSLTADDGFLLLQQILSGKEIRLSQVQGAVICSVVPSLTLAFERMVQERLGFHPLVVTASADSGLQIQYSDPQQLGADRIANAVAAFHHWGGPTVVVDLGTATTFDVIGERGEYLGGAIAPGVETSAEELFKRAARLPRVELRRPDRVVGRTTEDSVRAGVFWGAIGQIDEVVRRIARELGQKPKVVATGGWARLVSPDSQTIQECDPLLTLEGLHLLYERWNARRGRGSARDVSSQPR